MLRECCLLERWYAPSQARASKEIAGAELRQLLEPNYLHSCGYTAEVEQINISTDMLKVKVAGACQVPKEHVMATLMKIAEGMAEHVPASICDDVTALKVSLSVCDNRTLPTEQLQDIQASVEAINARKYPIPRVVLDWPQGVKLMENVQKTLDAKFAGTSSKAALETALTKWDAQLKKAHDAMAGGVQHRGS